MTEDHIFPPWLFVRRLHFHCTFDMLTFMASSTSSPQLFISHSFAVFTLRTALAHLSSPPSSNDWVVTPVRHQELQWNFDAHCKVMWLHPTLPPLFCCFCLKETQYTTHLISPPSLGSWVVTGGGKYVGGKESGSISNAILMHIQQWIPPTSPLPGFLSATVLLSPLHSEHILHT